MTTQAERDAQLIELVMNDDKGFVYSDGEWSAVVQAGLPDAPWLRGELQGEASLYLFYEATKGPSLDELITTGRQLGAESAISKEHRANAAKVARHAEALAAAMGEGAFNDESLVRQLESLAGQARRNSVLWGVNYSWMEGHGSKSPARMKLLERVIQLWHCASDVKMPGQSFAEANVGSILDVAWAATRPVLIGTDRFNSDGEAGRDALRKQIAKIRIDGFHYWRFDLDHEYQLTEQ